MALNPSGAISLAGPVAGQSIALELGLSPTATISLNDTAVRTLAGVPSGAIIMPTNFYGKSSYIQTQQAIFVYGTTGPNVANVTNVSNRVSNTGVISALVPGVGTARIGAAGSTYGGDKAICVYGSFGNSFATNLQASNLISNTGVVAADTPVAGTARYGGTGTSYGGDKSFVAYGQTNALAPSTVVTYQNFYNLISNTGAVASNTPAAGGKSFAGSLTYGLGKGIINGGQVNPSTFYALSQLVSDTGVFASTIPAAGTGRSQPAGLAIGSDIGIFVYGSTGPGVYSMLTSSVSNTGVLSTTSSIPAPGNTARATQGAKYGGDKAICAYGIRAPAAMRDIILFSNTGTVVSATLNGAVSPSRSTASACGFSST
jgi:hypothetical protein